MNDLMNQMSGVKNDKQKKHNLLTIINLLASLHFQSNPGTDWLRDQYSAFYTTIQCLFDQYNNKITSSQQTTKELPQHFLEVLFHQS
jgi:hypothetical protein